MATGLPLIIFMLVIVFRTLSNGIDESRGKRLPISCRDIDKNLIPAFSIAASVESFSSIEQATASCKTPADFSGKESLVTSVNCSPSKIRLSSILFLVRIPVLSTQITSVLPSISRAFVFLIIMLSSTIRFMPSAITIVDIAGRLSGMALIPNANAFIRAFTVVRAKLLDAKF